MNYQIKDSFLYDTEEIEKEVDRLYQEGKLSHNRSKKSYVNEWIAHNWLYSHGLFVSHTKDVDLNSDEKCHRLLAYEIINYLWRKTR